MAGEGSTIAKFAVPVIIGIIVSVGLTFLGRSLDGDRDAEKDTRDALATLKDSVADLKTDVAVIKAVVVDSNLAKRVVDLEADMRILKERLPK